MLTLREACNLADEIDPVWYFNWCENNGTVEELARFLGEMINTENEE